MKPSHRLADAGRLSARTLLGTALWVLLTATAAAATKAQTPPTQATKPAPQGQAGKPGAAAPAAECAKPARPQARLLDDGLIDQGVLEGTDLMEQGLEIGGLTTDQMVTKFGHDLFDAFILYWRPPQGVNHNLFFSELPDAQRGSVATIRLNDQVIFEGLLVPRDEVIQELGKGLARDIRNLLLSNARLEEEEYY
ncbi:CsgE family curli-type amyloid fiber assembly protein [uncultured Thiodictyon sp.]|uniref:CsgE family curli-type amyloid fiber assembly protein n=1 Tax=uncultured Thiodictyon sp. TaxID=1846217 RepID=UPI0025E7C674|nr:CsgE family curli-type amyloid fiber assembly protein [uncultured Thiodictyon sp.]